jgi:hypothetical protein
MRLKHDFSDTFHVASVIFTVPTTTEAQLKSSFGYQLAIYAFTIFSICGFFAESSKSLTIVVNRASSL